MVVFQDVLQPSQFESLCSSALDKMQGTCIPYIPDYASCPRPVMESSSVCISTADRYAHNCVGLYDHMCVIIVLGVAHSRCVCLTLMMIINAYQPQAVSSPYLVVFACMNGKQSTFISMCMCMCVHVCVLYIYKHLEEKWLKEAE